LKIEGGYAGKILIVDLDRSKCAKKELVPAMVRHYVGGRGFGSRMLWNEVNQKTDPLGPENVLIVATGPLTGLALAGCRFTVHAKSPLSGLLGYAGAGGHWGAGLKTAGFDAILVTGKSDDPVYLDINEGEARILSANYIWGEDTIETEEAIKENLGRDRVDIVSIGQAGENLVKFAGMCSRGHMAARTGMGAVMGSKKLKAIAVSGDRDMAISDPEKFMRIHNSVLKNFSHDGLSGRLAPRYGTTMYLSSVNEIGSLGTRNFQRSQFEHAEAISGERLAEKYRVRSIACFNCPIRCDRFSLIRSGEFAGTFVFSGPEYATLTNMGSRLGNASLPTVVKANDLCNRFGLDTYSTGGVIGFAMECFERGLITKKELDGIDLTWGNASSILELIRKIAFQEGIGGVLAEGTRFFAAKIGHGAEKFAIHVKGVDYPSIDARGRKDYGLECLVSNRGADHLYAASNARLFTPELSKRLFGTPEAADLTTAEGIGKAVAWFEKGAAMNDLMGVCKLCWEYYTENYENWLFRTIDSLVSMFSAVTGIHLSKEEAIGAADRVVNLERAFNARECSFALRKLDCFPERFVEEPLPDGPFKGLRFEQEKMLDEYYRARGWDVESGMPTARGLSKLGLEDVRNELTNQGKIPIDERGSP